MIQVALLKTGQPANWCADKVANSIDDLVRTILWGNDNNKMGLEAF